jgi:uncharacterized spore protein YtfJ
MRPALLALASLALAAQAQPLAKPLAEFDKMVAELKSGGAVGEPIRSGNTTVIPFAAVRFGLGSLGAPVGAAGGMGAKTVPLGVVIVEGDDVRVESLPRQEDKSYPGMQQLIQGIIDRKVTFMVNGLNIGNAPGTTADLAPLLAGMMGTKNVMVNGLNLGNLAAPRAQAVDSGKSIAELQAAAAKNPTPESYFRLGEALRQANQKEKAAAAYRQALKLRPNYPEATQALTKLK